jgi:peroxiredoxin
MTINIGDRLPAGGFMTMTEEGPTRLTIDEIFGGKTVVLFAVPGAFTPGCSMKHLPGYLKEADAILEKGADTIACLAVNDAFVMDAWAKDRGTEGRILMLSDGSADYVKRLGLELDAAKYGMGIRSKRFSMIVEDGVVKALNIDESGVDKSSAENTLAQL